MYFVCDERRATSKSEKWRKTEEARIRSEAKHLQKAIAKIERFDTDLVRTQYDSLFRDLVKIDPIAKGVIESPRFYITTESNVAAISDAVDALVKYLDLLAEKEEVVQEDEPDSSLYGFSNMHPLIKAECQKLFNEGHYSEAIMAAYRTVEVQVKSKSGRDGEGAALMSKVFNKSTPVLFLNDLKSETDRSEQEGFMHLFMGVMQGIRNPKAHENIKQRDPASTLESLALASLLLRRLDDSRLKLAS